MEDSKTTGIQKKMPIKVDYFSKRLWPRRTYLWVKTLHPRAGVIFSAVYTLFWFILAIAFNLLFLGVIFLVIFGALIVLAAALGDGDFDFYWIGSWSGGDKKKSKQKNPKTEKKKKKTKKKKNLT